MTGLYDLHTHTILSDGEMLPSELVRRMAVIGYTTVAITDHVDTSNAESVVKTLLDVRESARLFGVRLLCGVEITHVPPAQIAIVARQARAAGAEIVVVHGETTVEPVAPGTEPRGLHLPGCKHSRPPGPRNDRRCTARTGKRDCLRDHVPGRPQPDKRPRGPDRTRSRLPGGGGLGCARTPRSAGQDREGNHSAGRRAVRCGNGGSNVFKYRQVPRLLIFLFIFSRNL